MFAIENCSASTMYGWCESQLTPSRQIAAAIAGLRLARRAALQSGQHRQRRLVADLAQRQRRVVLQRAIDLGDFGERPSA